MNIYPLHGYSCKKQKYTNNMNRIWGNEFEILPINELTCDIWMFNFEEYSNLVIFDAPLEIFNSYWAYIYEINFYDI